MKFFLSILLAAVCTSASAQWYRVDRLFRKKREPLPALVSAADYSFFTGPVKKSAAAKIQPVMIPVSDYCLETQEALVMKAAEHNMRFRIYNDASYNFSELAKLYILQSRFSEAKWYLLQSNTISREENDNKHTIANLIDLAKVKACTGDYLLAQQDLTEAHDIAAAHGFSDLLGPINQKLQDIKQGGQTVMAQNTARDE
jgi:hypothetical protein